MLTSGLQDDLKCSKQTMMVVLDGGLKFTTFRFKARHVHNIVEGTPGRPEKLVISGQL